MSIQELPDESVVIISGTIVEVIVSKTEWGSWAAKVNCVQKKKLLLGTFRFLCSVHVFDLAVGQCLCSTYIIPIYHSNQKQVSIKIFKKRNLADVRMSQWMHWLTKHTNKKCHAHSDMHSIIIISTLFNNRPNISSRSTPVGTLIYWYLYVGMVVE